MRRDGPDWADEKNSSRGGESFATPVARIFPLHLDAKHTKRDTVRCNMGGWYWDGVYMGLFVAAGVLAAAIVPRAAIAAAIGGVSGFVVGLLVFDLDEAIFGAIGGVLGGIGAAILVAGALRRGGTRGGTGALVGFGALLLAAAAFVPIVGFLEAAAVPALGARMRRREPERHAGLRTLARD
jgi:hypothetical protein